MAYEIHVEAFTRLRDKEKYVNVGAGSLELKREVRGETVEWIARLSVEGADGTTDMGKLEIIVREDERTAWTALWKLNDHGVAKLDTHNTDSLPNLDEIKTPAGRLNRRKKAVIPAYLPHWRFVDPATGLFGVHMHDRQRFPVGMSIEVAVPKWCLEELHMEVQPAGVRYFRTIDSFRRYLSDKDLF